MLVRSTLSQSSIRILSNAAMLALGIVLAFLLERTANAQADRQTEFFEREIRPALVEHCYRCHSEQEKVRGGLRLDTAADLTRGGDSGPALVPGDVDGSLIIRAIRYDDHDLQMPPKGKLPSQVIKAFETWVEQGAADPRTSPDALAAMDTKSTDAVADLASDEAFWSFQPVGDPPVPSVAHADRVRTPIDAFVFARLEEQGISPAPPADKLTLIRRVTEDLTGLPPTPEQIEAFLADQSPDAFDTLVERLLGSPQYGVRWGRHWLDVARYADSNGLDENLGYGQAWRYRDYVIDAFNHDKPFDRFLIEQIAGDLVPGATQESKTATGFLSLGAKVLAEPDRKKLEMDIIDEQLDTLGKAFLGMTFGCVRCHDHKFDPITQDDYYALAAIFKSTKTLGDTNTGAIKHWYEHSFATEEERERLTQIDAEIAEKRKAASTFKNAAIAKIRSAAREQAADYLAAASQFDLSASLNQVREIAQPLGLHPRILHHCRMHLDFHREDALFATWHTLAKQGDSEAIRKHYADLFAAANEAWEDAKKQDPKVTSLDDPALQAARDAVNDPAGFLAVPAKEAFAFDAETLSEYYRLMEEARAFESAADDETAAMGVTDGEVVSALPIHIRGSHKNLGKPVSREFPEVMRISKVRPVFPAVHSGRLELAQWMADTRHPLTARVIVNRIWGWHFGQAIVGTTENFGLLGDRPSHPQLLDWLARRFMADGWSIKALHRLILRSSVYQMASSHPAERLPEGERLRTIDPENRLLWKANLRRLDAEQIRDAILAVSGRLDCTLGGKTLPLRNRQFVFNHTSEDHTKYDSLRRAVYLPVIRNNLYPFFAQFDYPDPTMPTGARAATVIAPQNLLLMNDDLVMDSANQLAHTVTSTSMDDAQCLEIAYQKTLGRKPTEREMERDLDFLADVQTSRGDAANARQSAWSLLCQGLMVCNEFIYLR